MVYTSWRRKLVKQGPSTLTVSLPAEWVRTQMLKPGDEVMLQALEKALVIHTEAVEAHTMATDLDAKSLSEEMLKHALHAAHKRGFDEIRLHCLDTQMEHAKGIIGASLMGFEIVEQRPQLLVIRSVMRIDAEELPVLLRRAFLVTLSLAEGIIRGGDTAEALRALEETNNRLTNYCERIIIRTGSRDPLATYRYLIAWLLEKIADEYRRVIGNDYPRADAEIVYKLLYELYELYYKYSFQKHDEFLKRVGVALTEVQKGPLHNVLRLMRQTAGSLIALALEEQKTPE